MTPSYEIGPFRLDARAKVLTRGGMPVPLGERGVMLLKILVDHAQEYVPKATLMDAAWPRVVVGESNLAVQISAIRRVLSQGGGQRWIETLPRRGYRYVGPVQRTRPLPAASSPRTDLPAYATSFIGREREQADIARLLQSARLLTLVGTGGIGKTRLAVQVAGDAAQNHADGVRLVELGALRDPARVPPAVAQALGISERMSQAPVDTLCAYLASRTLLLVLDNCEHLQPAVSALAAQLLQRARGVTILATSREPLATDGEQLYAVSSLSLPEPDAGAAQVGRSDAVRLFVARAGQQQPDFALDSRNAATVAHICTQLDGMPLALELAAARVRSLSVDQIAARLGDRFRLLAAGSSTALPRHHTLRAAMEWSFDLLVEDERVVLRRLAVFAGGFRLESAMAVASDAVIDEAAVVDVLDRLVRRSLVVADTAAATPRYRLLETTRTYALEKLEEAGEAAGLGRRHAQHFSELFAAASAEWLHSADSVWWDAYLPEQDNVRAALDWSFGAEGDASSGIALVGTSNEIWKYYSARREGRQWVETALARVDQRTSPQQEGLLWSRLGMSLDPPESDAAFRALDRAAALYRQCGDRIGLMQTRTFHGHLLAMMGEVEAGGQMLAELASEVDAGVAPRLLIAYLDATSMVAFLRGDLAAAQAALERALAVCRDMGAERFAVFMLSHLADVSWLAGDLDRAESSLREGIALAGRLPAIAGDAQSNCRANLIGVLVEKRRLDEALDLARDTPAYRTERHVAWHTMDHLALRAALAGKSDAAARLTGYTDAQYAQKRLPRQRNEQRARERADELLRQRYSAAELATLLAAGAALTDAAACELALEP